MGKNGFLRLALQNISPTELSMKTIIPKGMVDAAYEEVFNMQRFLVDTPGFKRGEVPVTYIRRSFKQYVTEHLKEMFLKHFVVDFLYDEIRNKKLPIAGEPWLKGITMEPEQDAEYHFLAGLFKPLRLRHWKQTRFKAPKRKNYRDLDRQVESLLMTEQKQANKAAIGISGGDWVCFDLTIINKDGNPLFSEHKEHLWLRIGIEAADEALRKLFADKKVGDTFATNSNALQQLFSSGIKTAYQFVITVKGVVSESSLSIQQFKRHFKLKTKEDVHEKLIEVFSSRNDLSQRRLTVEEALLKLLRKHPIIPPKDIITQQQTKVLQELGKDPDYPVYKKRPNFQETLYKLAEKLTKETILVDQISQLEHIRISQNDLEAYLNLTKRPRTNEFLYFKIPETRLDGQEIPIPSSVLKQCCLREKTLNHIINSLARK